MSWPLASFAIVLGVLLAGWLAYERSRPSARMAAVVATLAAVAALGRDAFVALPDVKPITAMTLVVGYALGPLPGFTVGALGMLASNILLGQGPYTPWQMAAWGLVGVAGAGLGRLSGRRLGRVGIALACGLCAMAAKEIMNIYTWTLGASHTPAALLAVAGAALPFDITDALASFLFGLAFGPELARLLGRMRARMDIHWEPARSVPPAALVIPLLVTVCAAGYAVVPAAHAGAPAARARLAGGSLSAEIAYLTRAQNSDGGFGAAPRQRTSELYSAWAAMGLAAAGRDPRAVTHAGHSVLDGIRGEASTLEGAGDDERTILALRAGGVTTRGFPGGDPLAKLLRARSADGSFGRLVNITTFAVFALRAAGRSASDPVVRAAGRWLEREQNPDGSFSFSTRGALGDVDDTAAALQGVVDAGDRRGVVVARAVAFLRRAQNPDGGYPQQVGSPSNAQSTAWAVQGLLAAGQDVSSVRDHGSRSPRAYLESLVAPDGSVRYSRTSTQTPVWVTAQALMALAGKPFPIAPVVSHAAVVHRVASVRAPTRLHAGARRSRPHTPSAPAANHPRRAPRRSGASGTGAPHRSTVRTALQRARLDTLARQAGVLVGLVLAPMLR